MVKRWGEHGSHFVIEHRDVAGHHRVRISAGKCGPRVQAHTGIDQCSVFAQVDIGSADGDLVNWPGLLTRRADDLREGRTIQGSG